MTQTISLLLIEASHHSASNELADVPPLGLAYIAAVAEEKGHSIDLMDMNIEIKNLSKRMEDAEFVGISCYTQNYHQALRILKIAKQKNKTVLIGGPHATPLYKEVLRDGFDYVVRGEGEYPVLSLLQGSDDLRGLAHMRDGITVANFVHRVSDLDSLPLPSRHLLRLEKYSFPGAIATTRGCASHCIFCSSRNQSGCLRARSVESLAKELEHLQLLGIDRFFVIDPNFAFNEKRTIEFCQLAKRLDLIWFSELRLDHMSNDVIKKMGESGCRVVRFGIESGSQRIVDLIKKGISLKDLEVRVRSFRRSGILPVCGFMIGHPTETHEDFELTLKLAKKIKAIGGEPTFAIQTPYPGTYLYKNASKMGVKLKTKDWTQYHHLSPVIETKNFSSNALEEMLLTALTKINPSGSEPLRKSFRSICLET